MRIALLMDLTNNENILLIYLTNKMRIALLMDLTMR